MAGDVVGRAVIDLSADASKLEAGMAKAERAVGKFEDKAVSSAGKAAQALGGSGKAVAEAGQQMDAASRRFIASLERESMQVGRTRAEYLELRAAKLGIGGAADPFLAQIRAGEKGMQGLAVSAGQTKQAFRQLPAQFTDIATSLASGSPAWMVLIQQGGQIKDSFGGVGATFSALRSAINPVTAGVGALAAVVGAAAIAYNQGAKEAEAFTRSIVMTGNAAGVTRGQLADMARSIDRVAGTQAEAADALAQFAASGRVSRGDLEKFTTTAIRLERVAGKAVADTVKEFAELGKAPVEASVRLNEKYGHLTLSIYEQIKALDKQGKALEAANLAQTVFATAMEQRTKSLEDELTQVQKNWMNIKDAAKSAWDSMLGIGRKEDVQDALRAVGKNIEFLEDKIARGRGTDLTRQRLEAARQLQSELQSTERQEASAADKQGAQVVKDRDEIVKRERKGSDIGRAATDLDIERIKGQLDQLTHAYGSAEQILEALRSRGLLSEREYFNAKLGFIRLNEEAEIRALTDQNKRLQAAGGTTKERLENEKKIAENVARIATLRGDAAAKTVTLGHQEAAAVDKIAQAYRDAGDALQDYLEGARLVQARDLEGFGLGDAERSRRAGRAQIEDKFDSQLRDLDRSRRDAESKGAFNDDAKARYDGELSLIRDFRSQALQEWDRYYAERREKEHSAALGAAEALANYVEESRNVAAQTNDLFTRSFKGIEDALTQFVATGKADFKGLVESVIAEVIRMQIIKPMLADIFSSFGGGGGSGVVSAIVSAFAQLFAGGRAEGGPIPAGKVALVGEEGPEFAVGPAQIIPMNKVSAGGGNVVIHQTLHVGAGASRNEVAAAMVIAKEQAKAEIIEMHRRGSRNFN